MIRLLKLLFIFGCPSVIFGSLVDMCTKSKHSIREPLVAALLDLHSGKHCIEPNVPAFQQLAVLESTVKQINEINKIKLGFQVFDTCSSEQGAVTAAMQAFVASQQTCLHSPLFAGFIGPENVNFLKAVKNFTSSFNFSHTIAYSVLPDIFYSDRAVYVSKYPTVSFAKAIEELIFKLNLKSPLIISEFGVKSRAISSKLRVAKPGLDVCSKRVVFTVSTPEELDDIIQVSQIHDGIVIIVESETMLKSVNRVIDSESIQDPVIVADLQNCAVQKRYIWSDNVILLNQVSFSESSKNVSSMDMSISNSIHSFITDSNRICGKYKLSTCNNELLSSIMEEEYDWSLQLYRLSVLLLGSSVEAAEKSKCSSKTHCLSSDVISQNEWHDFLAASSVSIDSRHHQKYTFGMNLPASYVVKASCGTDELKKIGRIDKDELNLSVVDYLPVKIKNVSCPLVADDLEVPTTEPTVEDDFFESLLSPENAKLFEAVGLVCGAIVGVLLMMLILTTCVYRNFNPESSRPRSPSSHTTMSRAGSISS